MSTINYLCTYCRSHLQVGGNIIVSAKGPVGKMGIILLHPELGNYEIKTHPEFRIDEGESYNFYCPVCHSKLNDKEKEEMVKLFMVEDGEEYEFYFSRLAGEKASFKVKDKEVAEDAGFHKDRYARFFDLPNEYKKYL